MCTVLLLLRPGDPWPLLVGANRDERLDRAFDAPARWWPDAPHVIGGRDRLGGGSWIGINDDGVFATIVNGMHRLGPLAGKETRGRLVIDALRERDAAAAARAMGALDPERYRGFTLLLADRRAAYAIVNDERSLDVTELAPGHHLVTPDGFDVVDSERYRAHFPAFAAARPPDPAHHDWSSWTALLRSANRDDPHLGLNIEGLNVEGGEFGTVASTLIGLPAHGDARMQFASGPPATAPYEPIDTSRVRSPHVESQGPV